MAEPMALPGGPTPIAGSPVHGLERGRTYPRRQRRETATLQLDAVKRVVLTMRDRLDEPLPLEAMADMAALSLFHFARVFHDVTGVTPARFRTALRMAEAKRLLLTTSLSVTAVCYQVGYNSLGSFTVRFTQSVGLSPGRFRRISGGSGLADSSRLQAWASPPTATVAGGAEIAGTVSGPHEACGPVFVGLFHTPIPEGAPVRCTVVPGRGAYRIGDVPTGTYHVCAVCFPRCDDGVAPLLADDPSVHVSTADGTVRIGKGSVVHGVDLRLRPVLPTDPPILVALPVAAPDGARKTSNPREDAPAQGGQDPHTTTARARGREDRSSADHAPTKRLSSDTQEETTCRSTSTATSR